MSILYGCIALLFFVGNAGAQSGPWLSMAANEPRSPVFVMPVEAEWDTPVPGPGLRMKKTGTTLTIAGAAMLIGGIALVSSADDVYYTQTTNQYGTYQEGDAKGALGAVMLVTGAGMTVTGIILWSKGARKYRRHLEMKESAKAVFAVRNRSFTLAYRF